MNRSQTRAFLLFIFIVLAGPAMAADEVVVEIDKIVVTDTTGKVVTAPDGVESISTRPQQIESVIDVIQETPGVHIRRYGGLENDASISIRGSTPDQVDVYLDGIPLSSAAGEGLSLTTLNAETLQRIEIYKNGGSIADGLTGIGGRINLKSKDIEEGWSQKYTLSGGSFWTGQVFAEVSHGGEQHDFQFGVSYHRTKGNFKFLDNNGTPLNANDDQTISRQNNEYQIIHPYLKWIYRADSLTEWRVINHVIRSDQGVPGIGTFQSSQADLSTTQILSSVDFFKHEIFGGEWEFRNKVYFRYVKSQFTDSLAEIGLGTTQDNDNQTIVIGDRLMFEGELSENVKILAGLEYMGEAFMPKDYDSAQVYGQTSSRHQIQVLNEWQLKFFQDRLQVQMPLRLINAFYNINNNDPSLFNAGTVFSDRHELQWTGTIKAQYKLVPELFLKGSVERSVRLPHFYELFGDQGRVIGNVNLVSESSIKYDAGLFFKKRWDGFFSQIQVETTFFQSHVEDLIQFEVASGFARASNIGSARIWGIEFGGRVDWGKFFKTTINYTFQQPKDRSTQPGNFLVGRPEHSVDVMTRFEKDKTSIGADFNYIDGQYLDALNTQRVSDRVVVNAFSSYQVTKNMKVGLEFRNITNSQVVDAIGFPLPGRAYFGKVDLRF